MALRYYRTTRSRPIDYMYRLNTPLMEKVLTANEGYIGQQLDQAAQIGQLANYEHLTGDDEDAMAITQKYNEKVDAIANAIRGNPAAWRDQVGNIRTLKNELLQDYTSGAISKQIGNYKQRQSTFDAIDKQVELYHTSGGEKGINPQAASLYKQKWDSKFTKTGFDPATRAFNVYQGGTAMDDINVKKVLADSLDKIKADKSNKYTEDEFGNGWMFNKVTEKMERITPDKVLAVASDNISPRLMQYLKERSDIGEVSGVYDNEGRFIQPYQYREVGITPEEQANIDFIQKKIDKTSGADKESMQQQLNTYKSQLKNRSQVEFNNESYLAAPLRGLMNTYSYSDIESGNDLSNNQRGPTLFNQAQQNYRQGRQLSQQYQIHQEKEAGINDRFKEKLDFEKYKWDNPHLTGKGTTTPKPGEVPPVESTVSKIATRSFEDYTIHDPNTDKDVPVLSNAGLKTSIEKAKVDQTKIVQELSDVNKALTNPNLSVDETNALLGQKQTLEIRQKQNASDLGQYRAWYGAATEATLTNNPAANVNLSQSEIQLYKDFESDRDGAKMLAEIRNARKKYPDVGSGRYVSAGTGAPGQETIVLAPQVQALVNKYNNYLNVRKRVDAGRENVLGSLRNDIIDNDAIQPGTVDGQKIANLLINSPQGLRLYDENGKPTAGKTIEGKGISWLSPSGDNYNLGFEGEGNNLADYISDHKVKVNVQQVGNTTKLGTGNAVIKVTFDDPDHQLPTRPFYITASDALNKDIARVFKGNKNVDVANIGKAIDNDWANSIRNQINKYPSVNRPLGREGKEPANFTIFVTNKQGNRIPLIVRKIIDGEATHLNVTGMQDGKEIGIPRVDGKASGFFNGTEDLIKNLMAAGYGQE